MEMKYGPKTKRVTRLVNRVRGLSSHEMEDANVEIKDVGINPLSPIAIAGLRLVQESGRQEFVNAAMADFGELGEKYCALHLAIQVAIEAEVVRDCLSIEQYDGLAGPLRNAIGCWIVHPECYN